MTPADHYLAARAILERLQHGDLHLCFTEGLADIGLDVVQAPYGAFATRSGETLRTRTKKL